MPTSRKIPPDISEKETKNAANIERISSVKPQCLQQAGKGHTIGILHIKTCRFNGVNIAKVSTLNHTLGHPVVLVI
jgi:hypothetical protein